MEELILQAFLQVETLGPHVRQGRYDLTGPDGEIILPSVWDKVIQPDWQIGMAMWPIEDATPAPITESKSETEGLSLQDQTRPLVQDNSTPVDPSRTMAATAGTDLHAQPPLTESSALEKIGRASCRERV